jgi:hypothetical protein
MPDQNQQPAVTPAEPTAPATPSAPSSAPAPPPDLQAKLTELENRYSESQRIIANAEQFFQADQDSRERLSMWRDSVEKGRPYSEILAERSGAKTPRASKDDGALTQAQIDSIVQQRLESSFSPISDQLAQINAERDAQAILKANPWATEQHLDQFQTKLTEMVMDRAQQELKANWPRMTPAQAEKRAWGAYADMDANLLFNAVMREARDEAILSGRRQAPKLPEGMTDTVSTGKDPALLDKVQKALKASEGNGDQVSAIIKEYAPQFGVNPDDPKNVLELYKKLTA